MKVKIIHTKCGAQMGWYLRDAPAPNNIAHAMDYMRMDGTQPTQGDVFNEICPNCKKQVISPEEMKRMFKDAA